MSKKFIEIVVEYPDPAICTYPEYKGKPYFSIRYEENGEKIEGFGTYKPEVLSEYIREYFIGAEKSNWVKLDADSFHCRRCGHTFTVIQGGDFMNCCPSCGADMRKETDNAEDIH